MPPREALVAGEFLEVLAQSRRLRLVAAETNSPLLETGLGPGELPLRQVAILRDLATVQHALGLDIRIPKICSPEFQKQLQYVVAVLKTGEVSLGGGGRSICVPEGDAPQMEVALCAALNDGQEVKVNADGRMTAFLEGHEIDLGPMIEECVVAKVRRGPTAAGEPDGRVELQLRCSSIVQRFERWVPKPPL
jgi:hypothetical protein